MIKTTTAIALAALGTAAIASTAGAEPLYVVNQNLFGQRLLTVETTTQTVTSSVAIPGTGLAEQVQTIDVRPATGELYGYTSLGRLITINPTTGATTQVGTTTGPTFSSPNQPSIDFNPTVDAIRFVTGTQNFRVNATTAAFTTDGTLTFSPGDANAGSNVNVRAAGYTNSFAGSTSTTLYDLEANTDTLVTQTPANSGLLQTVGPVGFGIADGGGFTGFDISGPTGTAYLGGSSGPGGTGLATNTLYTVNLGTGQATLLGAINGFGGGIIQDIAVVGTTPPPAVPEPASMAVLAGVAGLTLVRRRRA